MKKQLDYIVTTDFPTYRQEILDFWEKVDGDARRASFDSLYVDNPLGNPILGLCYDGKKLVGTENYLHQSICWNGKLQVGAIGVDTLVDPDYRIFHGVFGGLCKITHEELHKSVDILLAKPNENSKKYYLKYFDWQVACRIRIYKKVISSKLFSPRKVLSWLKQGREYEGFALTRIDKFAGTDVDSVIERNITTSEFAYFHKSAEYLDHKFLRNQSYATVGYLLVRDGKTLGYVVTWDNGTERSVLDLLVERNSPELLKMALSHLVVQCNRDRVEILSVHAAENTWYEPILKSLLFLNRDEFDFITRPFNAELAGVPWSIHHGDFDVF